MGIGEIRDEARKAQRRQDINKPYLFAEPVFCLISVMHKVSPLYLWTQLQTENI